MPTIGLSMIVKNGGDDLRQCLNSVRSLVDQIVVADTGSTDDSIEIAREFGALILSIPWNDHFAEARNAALAPVTTDWVLVLDADEELSPEAAASIPALLTDTPPSVAGYQLTIRNYTNAAFGRILGSLGRPNTDPYPRARKALSYCEHKICRLFRRRSDIAFYGRMHEAVEWDIRRAGLTCSLSELLILHYGTLADTSCYEQKQHRYHRMLLEAVQETPDLSHLWVQLAITERSTARNPDAALEAARRAVALVPSEYEAWQLIGEVLIERGRHLEAIEAIRRLPESGDWGITRAWILGDILHTLDRFPESRAMYQTAIERARRSSNPLPPEFIGALESRLGYVEVRIGMRKVGFRKLIHAGDTTPTLLANHERLMKAYISVEDDHHAAEAAETALRYWQSELLYRRAAALLLRTHQRERALATLRAGIELYPESDALRAMAV
jgi:tetratricopeptide (TPR) repeat protein